MKSLALTDASRYVARTMTISGASAYAGPPAEDLTTPMPYQPIVVTDRTAPMDITQILQSLPQDPFSTAVRALMMMSPEDRVRLRDLIDALNK